MGENGGGLGVRLRMQGYEIDPCVGVIDNSAFLYVLDIGMFVEIVVWRVPKPLRGSQHQFKYRLALIVDGACVLRYDNEAGKGDHRHVGSAEKLYDFTSPEVLLTDFWNDVDRWRR